MENAVERGAVLVVGAAKVEAEFSRGFGVSVGTRRPGAPGRTRSMTLAGMPALGEGDDLKDLTQFHLVCPAFQIQFEDGG